MVGEDFILKRIKSGTKGIDKSANILTCEGHVVVADTMGDENE